MINTSYIISPAVVQVPGTEWCEKALVWLSICLQAVLSRHLYQYLHTVIMKVRDRCGCSPCEPTWLLGDATCEKMGDLMASNKGRLLGLYDELSSFLSQLNLYRGKGVTLSHELALFFQLYNGHSWTRATGKIQKMYLSFLCLDTSGKSRTLMSLFNMTGFETFSHMHRSLLFVALHENRKWTV